MFYVLSVVVNVADAVSKWGTMLLQGVRPAPTIIEAIPGVQRLTTSVVSVPKAVQSIAGKVTITVCNGHVHTTEGVMALAKDTIQSVTERTLAAAASPVVIAPLLGGNRGIM